jgi:tRNA-dihydrouridine synthase
VFVDTARRVFAMGNAPGDSVLPLSSITSILREELIFLDSSNLSDLRKLLDHVEESANYILMLTRSTLERPWVLAELVRAHKCGKRFLVINASWPGDEASPQGRSFKFPSHLDEAIDEWEEYYYESSLRSRAMKEASERQSRLEKMLAGSILFQRLKAKARELLRNQTERPANASTWEPERWDDALRVGLSSVWRDSRMTFTRAMSAFSFKPLPAENEA